MCEPVTLGILTAASIGLQVSSQLQQGKAQQAAADQNANLARLGALDALRRGDEREQIIRERASRIRGAQRAATAAGNTVLDTGSAFDILLDTNRAEFADIEANRANAQQEALGLSIRANQFGDQGDSALNQSRLLSGATLLGGAATGIGIADRSGLFAPTTPTTTRASGAISRSAPGLTSSPFGTG